MFVFISNKYLYIKVDFLFLKVVYAKSALINYHFALKKRGC